METEQSGSSASMAEIAMENLVTDPSSGQTLYCRHGQKHVRSPVTGAKLRISNNSTFV